MHNPAFSMSIKSWRRVIFWGLLILGISSFLWTFSPVELGRNHSAKKSMKLRGCIYPRLNPFDPTIRKYIRHPEKLQCKQVLPEIVTLDNKGFLLVHREGSKDNGLGTYQCYYRKMSGALQPKSVELDYGPWEPVTEYPQYISLDIFEVRCYRRQGNINDRTKKYRPAGLQRLSIDILILESTSWNQFRRHYPQTWPFMKKTMNFTFFEKHGKADDNSLTNVIPILTGRRLSERSKEDKVKLDFDGPLPFNSDKDIPFLWNNFSSAGCVTFFNYDLDYTTLGFSFYPKWLLYGFESPPTDYYYRAGHMHHLFLEGNNQSFAANQTKYCRGNYPHHKLMLNLFRQFMETYSNTCRFSVSDSPGNILHGASSDGELVDSDLRQLLERLHKGGSLDNSMLLVVGDHGNRMDPIKYTRLGQIEERTPLAAILMPKKFQVAYPKLMQTLRLNTQRLTNHFDLYETMRDVLENRLEELERRGDDVEVTRRNGRSLFQTIPIDRDCHDAGILPQFCVCLEKSGSLAPLLPMTSPTFAPLSQWLNRSGHPVPSKAFLVNGYVFSTNGLVRRDIHHLSDNLTALPPLGAAVDFLDFVANISAGKLVHAQIQRTRQHRMGDVYSINHPPEIFESTKENREPRLHEMYREWDSSGNFSDCFNC